MSHTPKPGSSRGKVAIVEIVAPERTVTLVEVALDGETLTITDEAQALPLPDTVRELAAQLIAAVKEYTS